MSRAIAGPEIERLIQLLAKLPGLGPRSARRAALHLVKKREQLLGPLSEAMAVARERIVVCSTCGNVDTRDPCGLCSDPRRDDSLIVVVADISDLWALERSGAVSGRYHVLGGVLSALDGVRPEHLSLDALVARASDPAVKEVILALNATVDGQTTAHFITDLMAHLPVKVTKLAHGVPVGGELDYLDDGTLAAAIRQRTGF
ncbi:recombination protein RecR [Bosea sp. OAE752]|jgi:recombination protein RecR|uniref:Recombination protein RecR n=1 Tax=Bosea spartocytisi TaxID=2773451 RepID=A0A927E5S1_9HYPH|nr:MULTISPECIES: recombination mediator RecR [Bosea]MBD3845301.1 recombination protein RecR [Bosea spartocytisi]MCT4472472.1 recombination mediator RecR [Bosea spartocytisi]